MSFSLRRLRAAGVLVFVSLGACSSSSTGTPTVEHDAGHGHDAAPAKKDTGAEADAGVDSGGGFVIPPVVGDAGPGQTIATSPDLVAIALDTANVYWTDLAGTLSRVAKAGGAVTTLSTALNMPGRLAVDSTQVYVVDQQGADIETVPLAGGAVATLVAPGSAYIVDLAVDDTTVYWLDNMAGTVARVPKAGGAATTLATVTQVILGAMAIDDTSVYWTEPEAGNILSVPKGGGKVATLSKGEGDPYGIAVDSTSVYCTQPNFLAPVIRVAKGGGAVVTLGVIKAGSAIATDSTHVFWVAGDDSMWSVPKDGGANVQLGGGYGYIDDFGFGAATDGAYVYWFSENGGNGEAGLTGYLLRAPVPQ